MLFEKLFLNQFRDRLASDLHAEPEELLTPEAWDRVLKHAAKCLELGYNKEDIISFGTEALGRELRRQLEVSPPFKLQRVNKFSIGADPEFALVRPDGQLINFQPTCEQPVVGYDHGGRCVEIRPPCDSSVYGLLWRIRHILKHSWSLKAVKDHTWKAGAIAGNSVTNPAVTLGGHVHFGGPAELAFEGASLGEVVYSDSVATGEDVRPTSVTLTTRIKPLLIDALAVVATTLEFLDVFPRAEATVRRGVSQYGYIRDVRVKDTYNQNNTRFEYRAFPSWLYDPKAALLALTLAKLAVVGPQHLLKTIPTYQPGLSDIRRFLRSYASSDDDARFSLRSVAVTPKYNDPSGDLRQAWTEDFHLSQAV